MKSLIKLKEELAGLRELHPRQPDIQCQICGKWLLSVNSTHLLTHYTTVADYKEEYEVLVVSSDEMRQNISNGQIITKAEQIWLLRHWDKEIKSRAMACEILGVSESQMDAWRRRLNLKCLQPRWTPELIFGAISRRIKLKQSLRWTNVKEENRSLLLAAINRYKSWGRALAKLGINYNREILVRWTPQKIIRIIHERQKKGLPVSAKKVNRENMGLARAASRAFGNWSKALLAAGIEPDLAGEAIRWSREKIIRYLKERSRKNLGNRYTDVQKDNYRLAAVVYRYFKNWQAAIKAAGLKCPPDSQHPIFWTRERVIKALKERHRQKLPLYNRAVALGDTPLHGGAVRRFGSYGKAINAAGFDYKKIKKI